MESLTQFYANSPFWVWLAVAIILLAVEAAFSTEWLLWPAVAAGVVAIFTALGLNLGPVGEIALFGILTLVLTLASRRLIKRVNPSDHPDINSREGRLVGQKARVVEGFVGGRGRVFVSGAEWPALIEDTAPLAGENVVIESVDGPTLRVRLA